MRNFDFDKLYQLETTPEALEASSQYLADHIKPFLSLLEPVLICFPDEGPASLGSVFKRAVELCGAIAIIWGPDYRWQELLRLAFDSHANTIVGPPQVLLGLMKLSRGTGTPLYVYDVIVCGDPFPRWMVNGLKRGLDCKVWGCYAIHSGPLIAGFSCEQEAGIHIREDMFLPILERDRNQYPQNRGRLRFAYTKDTQMIYDPQEIALVQHQPCSCGCDSPRVVETVSAADGADFEESLVEALLTWTSVLDFRATNTENGLKLEVIVFPNEALPELPGCAKLLLRNWDPEQDVPFFVQDYYLKDSENSFRNH